MEREQRRDNQLRRRHVLVVVKRLMVLPALLALLAACAAAGADGSPASDDVSRAAVRDGGDIRRLAAASGTLRADPNTGCLWLEREDGKPTAQLLLQGEDYKVDFSQSPATVLAGDTVVATVGKRVEVGGGYTKRVEGVERCPVAGTFLGYFER